MTRLFKLLNGTYCLVDEFKSLEPLSDRKIPVRVPGKINISRFKMPIIITSNAASRSVSCCISYHLSEIIPKAATLSLF